MISIVSKTYAAISLDRNFCYRRIRLFLFLTEIAWENET